MSSLTWSQELEIVPPPPPEPEEIVEDKIYDFPDVEPQYVEGVEAMMKFISSNFKIPLEGDDSHIKGRIYVCFVIEKDGSISNAVVLKGLSPKLDAEAIRVIQLMPLWVPGMAKGKNIRCKYTLPISVRHT